MAKKSAKKSPARKPAAKAPARKRAAKKTAKKAPVKKASAKKAPARKTVAKKAPAKKVSSKKKAPAKKAPVKKAATKKAGPAKKVVKKKTAAKATPKKKTATKKAAAAPAAVKKPKAKKLPARELRQFRERLLQLRDRVVDGITFLAGDNLNRSQRESSGDLSSYSFHMADQGTDNFDREFALNLVSSEQDVIYEIDEALRRVDAGTYGICEITGEPIEKERLRALPHTRHSLAAQAELERGKARYRPFGATLSRR